MTLDPAFLTGLGAALSIFLSSLGSAIASAEAGIYALRSKSGLIHSFIPIVISGVLAIYGIIVSVILAAKLNSSGDDAISSSEGFRFLCAGLAVGLACAASGWGMASFIKTSNGGLHIPHRPSGSSVRPESTPLLANAVNGDVVTVPSFDIRYFFVMVFLEAIALYGLIVALFLIGQ